MSPIKHQKQSAQYFKSTIIFYRKYKPFVGLIAVVVIVGGAYISWNAYDRRINTRPYFRLSEDTIEIYRSVPHPVRAFYDSDGKYGSDPEQDVTMVSIWKEKNPEVAYVGKKDPTSGTIYPSKLGEAEVSASFAGISKKINIKVVNPPLVVTCEPRHVGPDENGEFVATKGSSVEFVATYIKSGVADYKYQWRTVDGQTSTEILPRFIFKDTGTYQVETTIIDRAGSTVSIQCKPLKVIEI